MLCTIRETSVQHHDFSRGTSVSDLFALIGAFPLNLNRISNYYISRQYYVSTPIPCDNYKSCAVIDDRHQGPRSRTVPCLWDILRPCVG